MSILHETPFMYIIIAELIESCILPNFFSFNRNITNSYVDVIRINLLIFNTQQVINVSQQVFLDILVTILTLS